MAKMFDSCSIANFILERLKGIGLSSLAHDYNHSGPINHLVIDNLLPQDLALEIANDFPDKSDLLFVNQLQESKYVGVDFAINHPLLDAAILSFQQPSILNIFSQIACIPDLLGDTELYAGGISLMNKGCYLNPHIDNSHDRLRCNYRRLNLLYYVSPGWDSRQGGSLCLYPNGISSSNLVSIPSVFNRLVVMRTDNKSLHGVSPVVDDFKSRNTISNYYFSSASPLNREYYHSTSFRGFKGQVVKGALLRLNSFARTSIRSLSGNLFGSTITTKRYRSPK